MGGAGDQSPGAEEFAGERTGAGDTGMGALAPPNMIGNLLMAGRSVSFAYNSGAAKIFATGSTNIINPAVAENNSPLPQDRAGFRYNHFTNALSVTGVSNLPPMADPLTGLTTVPTALKTYDVEQYTFSLEKTFLDRRASVEVRIPFQTTLSSDLNLSTARIRGVIQGASLFPGPQFPFFDAVGTPEDTLGSQRNELGNLSVILKGLLYQTPSLALSAGLSVEVPTANNTRVRVTDLIGPVEVPVTTIQRVREFDVKNETWAASPFLAALYTPCDRFFAQGFWQFDIPTNTSRVNYSETVPALLFGQFGADPTRGILVPPFATSAHLREQALMHIDLGTGFWVVRDPEARWLNGLAPTAELHYTTTLNSADLIQLPGDSTAVPTRTFTDLVTKVTVPAGLRAEDPPTVGNRRNHVDILDVTLGTTLLLGNRATLATAFSAPLRGTSDRTYDWEFHVQLNYYFGGPGRRGTFAPTF
jgi:hypothetical protein